MSEVMEKDANTQSTSEPGTHPEGSPAAIISALKNLSPTFLVNHEVSFHFKETTDKDTKEKIPARPKFSLLVPVPTMDGLIHEITVDETKVDAEGNPAPSKVMETYLLRLVRDDIIAATRQYVSPTGGEKPVNSQEELAAYLPKLSVRFLAEQPETERRGGGIGEEVWDAFEKNFVDLLVSQGRDADKVSNIAKLLVKKMTPVRTQKKVINFLVSQLDSWFSTTSAEAQEEFSVVYEFLKKKGADFLKADEDSLLENLM